MSDNFTLGEWLSQAQRSMGGGQFGRVSGPMSGYLFGPDFFRKSGSLQITDTFNYTYGKKVWDALNNKTVTFNAFKKVDWGPTVGWRLRTDRGTGRSQPVSEAGAIPTIDTSNYVGVYSYPKSVVSVFGVSLKAQAVSALEGGIGNQFAVEQEGTSRDHVKEINQELTAGSAYLLSGGTSDTAIVGSATAAYLLAGNIKIGDTVSTYAASDAAKTVTAVTTSSGTIAAVGIAGANGQVVYIKSRNGLTSIDDVAMDDSATTGGYDAGKTLVDLYNLTTRTAGTYAAAATCSYNAGVGRDLTLALVDTAIRNIRTNGGEPKLIVVGLDQWDKLNQLLQAQQRFVDVTDYIVGVGDERTYPGTKSGFQLATYRGVPILPDPDAAKSLDANDAVLGSNLYCFDTDYVEVAVMYPTQYIENRDYFTEVCDEVKLGCMLEYPVYLAIPKGENLSSGDNQQERLSNENPQRLYAQCQETDEDIVRPTQRCVEIGRNDQSVPRKCLYCGKVLNKNQDNFCSKSCASKGDVNPGRFQKGHISYPRQKGKPYGARTVKMEIECAVCGKVTTNKKYCSDFCRTRKSWNKGLTKETSPIVAQMARSHTGHKCYDGTGNGKCGYREDLGFSVRSTWEANVCRILNYLDIPYNYELKRFKLKNTTYCPDIKIYVSPKDEKNFYWEIKGYQDKKWFAKLAEFRETYPQINLKVIDKNEYKKMEDIYSCLLPNWEK